MPSKKQKTVSQPFWKRSRPSNHTAARLTRSSLSESSEALQMATGSQSQSVTAEEIKQMLAKTQEALSKQMKEHALEANIRMDKLASEIAKNDQEIKLLKLDVDQMREQIKQTDESNEVNFDDHEKRLIFLEDQSRRVNIRIRNMIEMTGEDLRKVIPQWLKEIIPNLVLGEEDIERVHRVGAHRAGPRDILVKFSNYYKKEQLMKKLRAVAQLKFQGSTVLVYNDLCHQTIKWRRSIKPITEELRRRMIKYAWGYPIFLRFTHEGRQHRVSSLEQGTELFITLGWDLQADAGSKSAKEARGASIASGK